MPAQKAERLAALMARDLPDDFVHVAHIGADRFKRHPAAMRERGSDDVRDGRAPNRVARYVQCDGRGVGPL